MDIKYESYLLYLLNNLNDTNEFHNELILNIYLTLLSLNNLNYHDEYYTNKINILEDYLRKVNNLKVKIQLKRKESEIETLLNEIKEIYQSNTKLIERYNKNKINILETLDSKDAKQITNLIDAQTKQKMHLVYEKENYDNIRNTITNFIWDSNYYISDNYLYLNLTNDNSVMTSLDDFYEMFDYLLDINNYKEIYSNTESEDNHKLIINELINLVENQSAMNIGNLIPIILTDISTKIIPNYEKINTSKFIINNIKITDLYSFANKQIINSNTAKWNKVSIPNTYLYNQIRALSHKGMYYFKNNSFILESIINNASDFKISINIDDLISFLKDNLNNMINSNL